MSETRVCAGCRQEKPASDYYRDVASPIGTSYQCKACDKIKNKDVWLKRLYGLSLNDYLRISAAQGGVCAVCLQPETDTWRGVVKFLAVDHDHQTGRVRGLLCARCNRSIGVMGDDPARLRAAAAYLEAHRGC